LKLIFVNKNENIIEICKCLVVLIKEANYNKKTKEIDERFEAANETYI